MWGSPNHFQAPEISDCEPLDKPRPTPPLKGTIGDDEQVVSSTCDYA